MPKVQSLMTRYQLSCSQAGGGPPLLLQTQLTSDAVWKDHVVINCGTFTRPVLLFFFPYSFLDVLQYYVPFQRLKKLSKKFYF